MPREQIVLANADEEADQPGQGMVLSVYPATEGLSHRQIRRVIGDHLDEMVSLVDDVTLPHIPAALGLPGLRDALSTVHRPRTVAEAERGRRRLAFDELFDMQLVVARARYLAKRATKGMQHELKKDLTTKLKHALPFELTGGQRRVIREITADMTSPERMHRLLMGDVGAGKTIVALFAMLLAVENDSQAVFMAPTELLTEQHARTLSPLLAPLGIVPELLIGRLSPSEKTAVRDRIASGASRIIVGTHALFQEKTAFHRLGLVVIDEQHRFGVEPAHPRHDALWRSGHLRPQGEAGRPS